MPVLLNFPNNINTGGGSKIEHSMIDTNAFTSKQETLDVYGSSIYIYESTSPDSGFVTLSDIIAKWGGVDSQNNYINGADKKYGINMCNWSEQSCNTEILFTDFLEVSNDCTALIILNAYISNWMNYSPVLSFVDASGNTVDEKIATAKTNALNKNFVKSVTVSVAGSSSLKDLLIMIDDLPAGSYAIHCSGHTKADNAEFTYNKLNLLCF